ncbi:hypothetical protein ABZU86_10465 [Streptomyces sp. NPDC005271]|uniref:hypothetical protein n=1 Tax=unclassified Streptomyces TaxID=2593676 RepID=UPI0033BB4D3C
MTQSGQGNEPHLPAVPPAQPPHPVREGVVLPAQGDQWSPEQHHAAPAGGQAWGQPWGPQGAPQGAPGAAGSEPSAAAPLPPEGGFGAPLPPEGQPLPPEGQSYGQQGWSPSQSPPESQAQPYNVAEETQVLPPQPYNVAEETQVLPPQSYNAAEETQVLPPQPAGDAEATRFIPPVLGRAQPPQDTPTTTLAAIKSAPLPPENRPGKPESPAESTTQLRTVRPGRGTHRQRQTAAPAPAPTPNSDVNAAEETAVLPGPIPAGPEPKRPGGAPYAIRPGRPGDRPPPSEFDGLFRADGADAPDETQQLPQFGHQGPPDHGGHSGHGGRGRGGGGGRRRMSRPVLIGLVVAGCGIAGLAAGAALSAGGGDDKKSDNSTLSSSSPSASEDAPSKAPTDPAQPQAKALDALLADSNNSRSSVIKAVDNIKNCKDLSTAASDLRTAAGQRNGLVTRLEKLSVDKLPNHAQLTAALTKAWKSSATADNQYAAWADQVGGGKKGCHKGKARRTPRVGAAELASGRATEAKKTAAGIWNPIATKYGLTQHQATDL